MVIFHSHVTLPHFSWENSLFLWQHFNSKLLVYQAGYPGDLRRQSVCEKSICCQVSKVLMASTSWLQTDPSHATCKDDLHWETPTALIYMLKYPWIMLNLVMNLVMNVAKTCEILLFLICLVSFAFIWLNVSHFLSGVFLPCFMLCWLPGCFSRNLLSPVALLVLTLYVLYTSPRLALNLCIIRI